MRLPRRIELYLDFLGSVRRVSPETVRVYELYLRRFTQYRRLARIRPAADIEAEQVSAYLSWLNRRRLQHGQLELSDSALDKAYDTLRAFCGWLLNLGLQRRNPFLFLRPPIVRPRPRPIAARSHVLHLLDQVEHSGDHRPQPRFEGELARGGRRFQPQPRGYERRELALRDACFYATLYFAGLRETEACCIRLADVDLREDFLRVIAGKGGSWRDVPIHRRLHTYITRWLRIRSKLLEQIGAQSEWLFVSMPGRGRARYGLEAGHVDRARMAKLLRERYAPTMMAKLPKNFTPHCLRHSFATRLGDKGVDVGPIAEILGHLDLNTTRIYMHYRPARLRQFIARA